MNSPIFLFCTYGALRFSALRQMLTDIDVPCQARLSLKTQPLEELPRNRAAAGLGQSL